MNRRTFILTTTAAVVPTLGIHAQLIRNNLEEEHQGDIDAPTETLKITDDALKRAMKLRTLASQQAKAGKDPEAFALEMLKIAESHAARGVTRRSEPKQVARYLNLFDLDEDGDLCYGKGGKEVIPFCACGVSYAASLAHGRLNDSSPLDAVKRASEEVSQSYFLCDSAVAAIRADAEQRKTWRDAAQRPKPKAGWLIVFRFTGGNHIGLVKEFHGDSLTTVEFNTKGSSGDQRNGGCVLVKPRPIDKTVKGYVALY